MNSPQETLALSIESTSSLLSATQLRYGIQVLLAVEAGSIGWEAPSADSEHEVRFIYKHDVDWYLRLKEARDSIDQESPHAGLNLGGWELRKTLRAILKSQAIVWEWLQSPITYQECPDFRTQLMEVSQAYFSPKTTFHHYNSLAAKTLEGCRANTETSLTKYLEMMRATLACKWIYTQETIPPSTLTGLLEQDIPGDCLKGINELILNKKSSTEDTLFTPPETINKLVENLLLEGIEKVDSLPTPKSDPKALDDFFVAHILPS